MIYINKLIFYQMIINQFLYKKIKKKNKKLNLIIPTNMPLAPEIKIELKEIEKNIDSKVQELND